jgi:hypothetical protein
MLPKLAKCGHFRPAEAGDAAARGTRLDAVFRAWIAGETVDLAALDAPEREAVQWSVDTARALSGGAALQAAEDRLRVAVLGLEGTADLLCIEARWSADLKSGQKRGYREQQAAYALGFMEEYLAEEWTVYVLYCDLQEVETLRFTRPEAERVVREALARARGEHPPAVNEYCGWCARRFECPARKEALGIVPLEGPATLALADWPSPLLREFVLRAAIVEDFSEQARAVLKERCVAGERIPGVALNSKRGARKLEARALAPLVEALGAERVLTACGLVSEAKAREVWQGVDAPFPAEAVQEMPGSSFVRVGRPKGGQP